jgi:hypothetical protein
MNDLAQAGGQNNLSVPPNKGRDRKSRQNFLSVEVLRNHFLGPSNHFGSNHQ